MSKSLADAVKKHHFQFGKEAAIEKNETTKDTTLPDTSKKSNNNNNK